MNNKNVIKKICVSCPNTHPGLSLGTITADALKGLGFQVCESEKIEDFVKSDAILIISGMRYPNLPLESLEHLNDVRPVVIVWQIDPVPPPEFTLEAEKIGVLINRLSLNNFHGKKNFTKIIPLGREFTKVIKWLLSMKLERTLRKINGYSLMPSEGSEWGRMMDRFLTFREYLRRDLIDYSFTSSEAREKFFRSRDMDVRFIPVGYHPQFGRMLNLHRDIDVLFLGRINNKRRKFLIEKIARNLRKESVSFTMVDDAYGDARTELLNRAKIVLDIPRVPWETGGIRFLMAMSCGALVVSTNSKYTNPYKQDVHFTGCNEENITDSICYYLSNDVQRRKIVDNAYEFVTKELTAANMMSKIMEVCNAYTVIQDGSQRRCDKISK